MNITTYLSLFDPIIKGEFTEPPYDNPAYVNYTKLNASRQKRWLKTASINGDLAAVLGKIDRPQKWIIITEPWCGDAAHNIPFIVKMTEESSKIELVIEHRDAPPHRIENYLTNGGKSIPKLIVQNENGQDLFTWGPRPAGCQELMLKNKNSGLSAEEQKIAIQDWYNKDKGETIQREFLELLEGLV